MHPKRSCFLVLIVFILFFKTLHVSASDTVNVAKEAINRAESSLVDAYKLVLDGEKAGADVTSFMEKLNMAGGNLTNAYLLYEAESYDDARASADNCYAIGEKIKAEAETLRATATIDAIMLFWFQMFVWVGTLVVIILASIIGWRTFKQRYYRNILEMKPEAANNES